MMTEQWKPNVAVSPSTMELPKKKDGEVDWHTLGNILVAHALGEVVCASYVDNKFGKQQEGFIPVTNWKFAYEEKNVVVLVKELEDSPLKCFMGRSVIDLPPRVLHECVSVAENAHYWDKYVVESTKVKSFRQDKDVEDCISYMRCEAWQCLVKSKRDFLFYTRHQYMPESGKCISSVLSVDYPSCPPVPGVDRGQVNLGSGWVFEPYNGDPSRTLVSYLVHADLVGLPSLIMNRAMRRQPLNIHYLSRHLIKSGDTSTTRKFSLFSSSSSSRPKASSHRSTQSEDTIPDCSLITPEIPTPDAFHDQTGYTFSAVTLGSNPLYNNWSTSTSTSKEKNGSLEGSFEEGSTDESQRKLEESESVLDFRVTSLDSGEKRTRGRPSYLWLPSLRNLEAQGLVKQPPAPVGRAEGGEGRNEGTDGSLPSSDYDTNCKRPQMAQTGSGLTTRE